MSRVRYFQIFITFHVFPQKEPPVHTGQENRPIGTITKHLPISGVTSAPNFENHALFSEI
jgi:hypothetical protein